MVSVLVARDDTELSWRILVGCVDPQLARRGVERVVRPRPRHEPGAVELDAGGLDGSDELS